MHFRMMLTSRLWRGASGISRRVACTRPLLATTQPIRCAPIALSTPRLSLEGGRSSLRCHASLASELDGDVEIPATCPGCGIRLQQTHPNKPGFLTIPKKRPSQREHLVRRKDPKSVDPEVWTVKEVVEDRESEEVEDARDRLGAVATSAIFGALDALLEEDALVPAAEEPMLVCERCFSLRNYGKLKNVDAEALVPTFSVENVLQPKIAKNKGKKVVIVCVVDLFDFEGSLPLRALKSLFPASSRLPDFLSFIFVGNKVDLMPKSMSKEALEVWVRTRLKALNLPFAKRVHLISSHSMYGVRELMIGLRKEIIRNTDCYIIGVQNAGKSSMLNALRKLISEDNTRHVTTASLPGTTLGFVEVPGFKVAKTCRVFDTPGIEVRSQISSRLTMEELKMVQPRRMIKPRTYRFGVGRSLLIGGLARLDLTELEGSSLYATAWVSEEISLFLGKTETIEEKVKKHRGTMLRPPLTTKSHSPSAAALVAQTISLEGTSWKSSSVDICIAGLGWIAVGCQAKAEFSVWTLPGIEVTTRPAMQRNYAPVFQKPGFSDSVKSRGLTVH